MLMFLVVFLTPGCIAKSYIIKVYTVDWATVNLLKSVLKSDSVKAVLEDTFVKNHTQIDTYTAKEIISYTETSIRFIDNAGKEQFISADYIEVEQR